MKWSEVVAGDVFEHTPSGSVHLALERDGDCLRVLSLVGVHAGCDHWVDVRRLFFRDEQKDYVKLAEGE